MNTKHSLCLVCILFFINFGAFSQGISIDVSADTSTICIGEQTNIVVDLKFNENSQYQHFNTSEYLYPNIKLLHSPIIDTIATVNNQMHVRFTYRITSFEPGSYSFKVGPYVFQSKDSVWSNQLNFVVNTVDVDTAAAIKPIKSNRVAVYTWRDYVPKILSIVAQILLLALLLFFGYRYWKKRKLQPKIEKIIETEKADIKAIRMLGILKEKKLCENSYYKEFYSELTDILREYFEQTLNIQTFERTSDELLQDIALTGKVSNAVIQNVKEILTKSDLVKFAKYTPLIQDSALHYGLALFCVQECSKINTQHD